jgi:hypothetical protein
LETVFPITVGGEGIGVLTSELDADRVTIGSGNFELAFMPRLPLLTRLDLLSIEDRLKAFKFYRKILQQ